MIGLTHVLVAFSIAYVFELPLMTSSIFSLVPGFDFSFDLIYPFVSHGLMHSLMAGFLASGLVYMYTESRSSAVACFAGYFSALGLELLTTTSIPLLFPSKNLYSLGLFSPKGLEANAALISISLIAITAKKYEGLFKLR